MARRRYLIAYDVAEPKRLRAVSRLMEAYGERVQYSVFICDLNLGEVAQWRSRVSTVLNMREDSVLYVDLGFADGPNMVQTIGKTKPLPEQHSRVL